MATLNMRELGAYIRDQRHTAQISMRQLAKFAGVSNPYLSQIERGMRKPSAEILQQIAKALRISAEALYVQAGILDERGDSDVPAALLGDPYISERQKQVLVEIYESFRRENAALGDALADPAEAAGPLTEPTNEPVGARSPRPRASMGPPNRPPRVARGQPSRGRARRSGADAPALTRRGREGSVHAALTHLPPLPPHLRGRPGRPYTRRAQRPNGRRSLP
jgi:transcriptional regulator with XRE-family HTH domain